MDKTNSKILTLSFAIIGALSGFVIKMLLATFSGVWGWMAKFSEFDLIPNAFKVHDILPVIVGFAIFLTLQFNRKVLNWGNEVVAEIRKVVWPSRKDTTAMTIAVIVMVLLSSAIITLMDYVTGAVLKFVINL